MKPPLFLGRCIYFFGYPIFRILIKNTYRAYVVVRYKDKILVTKNWLGHQKKWRLPGGGVHKNERPALAASRELLEEVGIRVTEKDLLQLTQTPHEARYGYLIDLFVVSIASLPKINPDEREIIKATFMSKDELLKQECSEELLLALSYLS
ncbi:MAG: NUDIX hydrolase [Candidatus Saccharimonadales bacterium]